MSSSRTGYKRRLSIWFAVAIGSLCTAQLGAAISRSPAQAQEAALATEEDIANYASAVSAIEPLRIAAYEAASDVLVAANSEVNLVDSRLSCLSSDIEDMPAADADTQVELQRILVEYCNAAKDRAEANNLTPQRFNAITDNHREDGDLAQRIRAAIASTESVSLEPVEE